MSVQRTVATAPTGWLGYDWIKLIIALILAALLLWLYLAGRGPNTFAPLAPPALTAPANGATVSAGTVELQGTGAPGSTVQVVVDGQPAGTATVDAGGAWRLPVSFSAPGEHTIIVNALDNRGTVAASAPASRLVVAEGAAAATAAPAPTVAPAATAAPAGAAIAAPTINLPGAPVAAGTIRLSGTGTPGSTVDVTVDGASVGTATVGPDGAWSLDTTIARGAHKVVARALDAAGAVAAAGQPADLSVGHAAAGQGGQADGAAAAPAIAGPADGATIGDASFDLSGTGAPGSTVEILAGGQVLGTATVGSDGTWVLRVTPSANGSATYGVRPAGASGASSSITVTISGAHAGQAGQAGETGGTAPSELPNTGGDGTPLLPVIALACALLAGGVACIRRGRLVQ